MSAEDYTPIYVGDTAVPFAPTFTHKDGTAVNLSGATISMKMVSETGTTKTCSGSWTIDNASAGQAHYNWQNADVSTAGTWTLYVVITTGGSPVHADPKLLEIQTAP